MEQSCCRCAGAYIYFGAKRFINDVATFNISGTKSNVARAKIIEDGAYLIVAKLEIKRDVCCCNNAHAKIIKDHAYLTIDDRNFIKDGWYCNMGATKSNVNERKKTKIESGTLGVVDAINTPGMGQQSKVPDSNLH